MRRPLGCPPAGKSRGHRVMGPGEGEQGLLEKSGVGPVEVHRSGPGKTSEEEDLWL